MFRVRPDSDTLHEIRPGTQQLPNSGAAVTLPQQRDKIALVRVLFVDF